MADNKKRKYENCTICGDKVIELREVNAVDDLDDSEVLEIIKELNRGDVDESKISTFVACKTCRDEAATAYKFIKKCRSLTSIQSSVDPKQFKVPDMQPETPELIIIVNQLSNEVNSQELEELFSEYGRIVHFYFKENNKVTEKFAFITLSSEDETLKVMTAARNKQLCYGGEPLVVTRVSEDSSPIDTLPDICLSEIFLHLDKIEDKVQIGKVCKRWKEVLTCSWSNMRNLSDTLPLKELISVPGLTSILKGCGHFLKRMKLDNFNCSVERIFLISKYCKNLENLQLELNCEPETGDYEPALLSVFQQCTNLRRIFIFRLDQNFDYNYLQYLSEEMLEIHLTSMDFHTKPSINLSKFQNLQALALRNFNFQENSELGELGIFVLR